MFAGHLLILRVHKTNFRSQQVAHNTYDIAYNELLSIHHDVSIHQRQSHKSVTRNLSGIVLR